MQIGIAGAGLLGRLLAWRLLLDGHKVSLYDAGSLEHCAGAAQTAAAMISPLSEVVDSERFIYDLGMASMALWPEWLQQLSADVLYQREGSLVVAHQLDAPLLQRFAERLQFHLGSEGQYQWLQAGELKRFEPALEGFSQALYLQDEAHIDNHQLLHALLTDIDRLGGTVIGYSPVDEVFENTLMIQGEAKTYDLVLDCRGVGAKAQLPGLRGVRGEVLWVETDEVSLTRPVRFMHPRYKLYVVPRQGNRFIIGATEIESDDLSPVSLRSTMELSSALYALNPAFAEARVIKMDVNLRPSMMDNLPCISQEPGCLRINGLYRHGYLLAPAVVEATLAMINNTSHTFLAQLQQDAKT